MAISETKLQSEVESLIDSSSLSAVLVAIAEVCRGKAEHIYRNWQDETLGRCWDDAARGIEKLNGMIAEI